MREMKDSGVGWIGEIPQDWTVCRFKDVVSLYTGNSIKDEEKGMYQDKSEAHAYIATKDIDAVFNTVDYDNGLYIKDDDLSFRIAPAKSCLMCIEGGSAGRKKAQINQAVSFVNKLCCFSGDERVDAGYLYYFLNAPNYETEFNTHLSGLIGGVSVSVLKNICYLMPPMAVQHRIADYLGKKCAKIDNIISKQQKIIEKLKTYKLSIITETVTSGLNPDVEMKDSGIEFLGQVPLHWEIIKFGKCITIESNLVSPEEYYNYPQISPDCIEKNSGKLLSYKTVKDSGVISWNHLFFKDQIIYSKIRPLLNKVVIAPFDGLCSADMYPIETDNVKQFIVYLMLSEYFSAQVALVTANRVKMPKINQNELSNIFIALPAIEEQKQIADFLDRKCEVIDNVAEKKQKIIDKLAAYKKSLIYEAVTGKKELAQCKMEYK